MPDKKQDTASTYMNVKKSMEEYVPNIDESYLRSGGCNDVGVGGRWRRYRTGLDGNK